MKFVVDANILFSFFKKESTPREIILDPELKYNLDLFAPQLVLREVGRHKKDICSRFCIESKDFEIMFSSLELFIRTVNRGLFEGFLPEADEILSRHIKDSPYAALCLWFKKSGFTVGLWSNEKRLRVLGQQGIKVYNTKELVELLKLE